ncbi:hypothetical protein BH769_gp78 [Gordonia phage BritBrat]|uniref:Uncharacterized protein n=1 Tax=Gordonia phage BritBrat TaxID=1838064 RepID=A0A166Y0K6_9CAUD|nr:hypothetical protein BH769_gp78 [Gordonia phage BritBrat]ANA85281.1 hypothetical protein PBI_BRITBRAT_78 [Gordonia phage BritBrat]
MGWVIRSTEPHQCLTPGGGHTDGDLWRCDNCGDLWAWTGGSWGWATRWEHFQAWLLESFGLTPDPRVHTGRATVDHDAMAQAWDEGFEAGSTWSPSGPAGVPNDPPPNPYDGGAS